jgi:phosphomannomutase
MDQQDSLIVSVSGIRGIVGRGLTPEAARAFSLALGTYTQGGKIVLSRDGRPSGTMLRHAVLSGLLSSGCQVCDVGVAPTPTCGLAVRRLYAAGGMQITASHNPAEWNGLKLFGPQGSILTAAEGRQVQAIFERTGVRGQEPVVRKQGALTPAACSLSAVSDPWPLTPDPSPLDWHRDRVLELVDVPRIRAAELRTFLDANGGAGGPLGRGLLEALQTRPVCHACAADGLFQHEPEPVAANLQAIGPLVAEHGADIGLVLDPDADRLALIDETGRYIGEELTLALAVRFRLQQERGPVVINMSTSRLVEDIALQFGCSCHRAAVGEANVVERMKQVGAVIGGEGNGGVIDPRVGYVRDPFIGMALVLNFLAVSGHKLSTLVKELPAYAIVKDKQQVARERLPDLFAALEKRWPEAMVNREDGLRLDWQDRWIHVRPSNTEPIVRVIAEAPREDEAERLCRDAREVVCCL